jgi:hypothetical protein
VDAAHAAQEPRPLPDAFESETVPRHDPGIESGPPVPDLDANAVSSLSEADPDPRAAAMPARIGEGLLADTVDGLLENGNEPIEIDLAAKLDRWTAFPAVLVDKVGDSLHDPQFIEDRGPDSGNQTPGLEMGLPEHGHPGVVGLCRKVGISFIQVFERLKLHDRPGQLLCQAIVKLIGDTLAVAVARLQQVHQSSALTFVRRPGLPALVHVSQRRGQAGLILPAASGERQVCDLVGGIG